MLHSRRTRFALCDNFSQDEIIGTALNYPPDDYG